MGQCQVLFGVDAVEAGADHRHGSQGVHIGPFKCAFMGCTVDTQRQPRDKGQTTRGQVPCKGLGIEPALRRGVAAADHGQGALDAQLLQGFEPALHIQQAGRVGGVQQGSGVAWVVQREHGPAIGCVLQPLPGGLQQGRRAIGRLAQGFGHPAGHHLPQGRWRLCQHLARQAKSLQ